MTDSLLPEDLLIIDGHCDTVLEMAGINEPSGCNSPRPLLQRSTRGHIDLPRLLEAGVSCQFFALFTSDEYLPVANEHCQGLLELVLRTITQSGRLQLACSSADILEARASGRIAVMLAIEGGEAIGSSLDQLQAFYEQGVRLLTLTWNHRNAIGRGVGAEGIDGLSPFGEAVLREMENLGMLVDVSHLADTTLTDVLRLARRPLVASHSNCRALCPHRRNLTDDQIRAIAATGGLVGLTFAGSFVDSDPAKVNLERFLQHLDHMVEVAGVDHVGIGSDFDGFSDEFGLVMSDCTGLPGLAVSLLKRGYALSAVQSIMGGNWLRVISQVLA
ncbi:MAG: dipeptidase [Spirochaetes bacterium]|nr:dipeptidase [Spirochaetota bacterium]MBU0956655.1 dipeptidase [Spirochaetota bacterium]